MFKEVFGFDDFQLNGPALILEFQVRPLHAIMKACESVDELQFNFTDRGSSPKFIISSGDGMFTFANTTHELPVVMHQAEHMESAFREPLISRPAVTFSVPSIVLVHDKLARLAKYSSSLSLAANHNGRLVFQVSSMLIRTEFAFTEVQVIRAGEQVKDPLELQEITLQMDSLVRVLGCTGAMLGQVLCAVVPNESIIFSCKIPNPCGHDRPAGTMTLILAAHTPN